MPKKKNSSAVELMLIIQKLAFSKKDLAANSLDVNKALEQSAAQLAELFSNSYEKEYSQNYLPADLTEVFARIQYAIRRHLLRQFSLLIKSRGYKNRDLQLCYDDFLFLKEQVVAEDATERVCWGDYQTARANKIAIQVADEIIHKLETIIISNDPGKTDYCRIMLNEVRSRLDSGKMLHGWIGALLKKLPI